MKNNVKPIVGLFRLPDDRFIVIEAVKDGSNSPMYFDSEKDARNCIRRLVNKKL